MYHNRQQNTSSVVVNPHIADETDAPEDYNVLDNQPTLPTGEVIDGKNTLQTFSTTSRRTPLQDPPAFEPTVVEHSQSQPTLPNIELINSKNTLQSFGTNPGFLNQRIPLDPPAGSPEKDEVKQLSGDPPNPVVPPQSTTVVAMAVEAEPNFVYAQLAPQQESLNAAIDFNGNQNNVPSVALWKNHRATFVLLAIFTVSISLALGLGLYFGLHNGSSGQTVKDIGNVPTGTPVSTIESSINPTLDMASSDVDVSIRTAVLTSYINNITLSNQSIAFNGTSPESMALKWLIFNDTTLETTALTSMDAPLSSSPVGFSITQRYPLLVMWFQQTENVTWTSTDGWLVERDECNWFGITCEVTCATYDESSGAGGVQNAVTKITFDLIRSYVGVLPLDIGLLSNLQHFEITTTRDLEDKNKAYLQGTLPYTIGKWTALTYFDVRLNSLSGSIPNSVGSWTGLTYFDVSDNTNISIVEDEFSSGISGTLPTSIGQWTALTYFAIRGNLYVTGTLPGSIDQWTALTFFDAAVNDLYGTLPSSMGKWTALTHIDVSNNSVNGTLPANILRQLTALNFFNVGVNVLSGTLPDNIGQWTTLTFIDVSNNLLNGTIPLSIGNWSLIEYAWFYSNELTGTVPVEICQFVEIGEYPISVDCEVSCTCCDGCF
jgi:hypothetical protein